MLQWCISNNQASLSVCRKVLKKNTVFLSLCYENKA